MSIRDRGTAFVNQYFHALTHRNFRYIWFGQCVSLVGTWMQNIGQSWLVLTLTGSPLLLGLVGAFQFLPIMLFSLFAGVIIDKFPKRSILLVTQTVSMLLAFILAALVFTHSVRIWHILLLALLLGLNNTLDMPTRQSFNVEIVGKEDLMNAIALNSTTFNLARIVGPAIGALMMAYLGAGWCFLLNGLSFIAVLYGLLRVRVVSYVRPKATGSGVFREIRNGIRYLAGDRRLAQTVLLVTVVGTLAYNFNVLIPVFTRNVLHQGEATYGTLMSCLGAGSLIGALVMSVRSRSGPKIAVSAVCSVLVALCLIANGLSASPLLSGALLAVNGLFNIMFATNSNSYLQMHTADEYRARVMSVYTLVFAGSTPIGNLLAGYAADRYGASGAYIVCGVLCLVPCIAIIWMLRIRSAEKRPDDRQENGLPRRITN
ncbi:MFS transporter [Paenibacillus athensensis]|uniref:MFS transporter n=1 Tax=Paenibacillus athensensis TaxID=1967502 RepID=A0A4Y8Q2V7_9BACL|nr:MFS transporter [Paenibacillus athensensis]MCD1258320.1 MFS transporter [Paenibacillus athensensis]